METLGWNFHGNQGAFSSGTRVPTLVARFRDKQREFEPGFVSSPTPALRWVRRVQDGAQRGCRRTVGFHFMQYIDE